jgi:hypothetical protein
MRERENPQTDRGVTNQRSGENLRRKCTCGRIITGNAAWWSHLNSRTSLAENRVTPGCHAYGGRA